jgi:C_GCAxxG_C_C family probable redox protein
MDKKQAALALFQQDKFNCAQAAFAALADGLDVDRDTALKTAACFGGGMRCGEVCGAVTGALMALGVAFGSCTPRDAEGKQRGNDKAVEFNERFKAKNGTLLCRDLLGYNPGVPEDAQKISELGLHGTVCPQAIADAVEIATDILARG